MKNRLEGKGQHEVITLTILPSLRPNSGWKRKGFSRFRNEDRVDVLWVWRIVTMMSPMCRFWELWDVVADREEISRMRECPKGVEVRRSGLTSRYLRGATVVGFDLEWLVWNLLLCFFESAWCKLEWNDWVSVEDRLACDYRYTSHEG